jgi:hypothetical protein
MTQGTSCCSWWLTLIGIQPMVPTLVLLLMKMMMTAVLLLLLLLMMMMKDVLLLLLSFMRHSHAHGAIFR